MMMMMMIAAAANAATKRAFTNGSRTTLNRRAKSLIFLSPFPSFLRRRFHTDLGPLRVSSSPLDALGRRGLNSVKHSSQVGQLS